MDSKEKNKRLASINKELSNYEAKVRRYEDKINYLIMKRNEIVLDNNFFAELDKNQSSELYQTGFKLLNQLQEATNSLHNFLNLITKDGEGESQGKIQIEKNEANQESVESGGNFPKDENDGQVQESEEDNKETATEHGMGNFTTNLMWELLKRPEVMKMGANLLESFINKKSSSETEERSEIINSETKKKSSGIFPFKVRTKSVRKKA